VQLSVVRHEADFIDQRADQFECFISRVVVTQRLVQMLDSLTLDFREVGAEQGCRRGCLC
jgi:hypothetical protein